MKLPTFTVLNLIHSPRKERSISLATAQLSWFTIVCAASASLVIGGALAMYAFTGIDITGQSIIVDPPQTISYKKAQVDKALETYRAKARYFKGKSVPAAVLVTPPISIEVVSVTGGTTTAPVASTTSVDVQ